MKIKRYKIKGNATKDDIIHSCYCSRFDGGKFVISDADFTIFKFIKYKKNDSEFSINISFRLNIQDWNDFDNILVLDEDWCQPYTLFYDYYDKEVSDFPTLEYIIAEYNKFLDSLNFLEEVKG